MKETVSAIIVAAGEGRRLGAPLPKAFVPLAGKPMFVYSTHVFCLHPAIEKVTLVVSESMMPEALAIMAAGKCGLHVSVEAGGTQRWQSVHNGVLSVKSEWVLVHDAARPFVDATVIDSLWAMRDKYRCVITGTPSVDTMRTFEGDRCLTTIDRSKLVRVGTPQLFHRQTLLDALSKVDVTLEPPTDEALLMEQSGIAVGLAWGDPMNFKITTPQDLQIAEAIISQSAKTVEKESNSAK
jgi:2-C-methyl-D-erythritol 4-phosphate cytidylyltransferase